MCLWNTYYVQGTEDILVNNEAKVPALTEYSGEETEETFSWWWWGKAVGIGREAGRVVRDDSKKWEGCW